MKRPLKNLILAALIGLTVGVAAAIWMYFLPYLAVSHIRTSLERGDADALSRDIDFPTLRSNLKDQVNYLMTSQAITKDSPFAALGMLIGGSLVNNMIDAYVTPYGLSQIITDKFQFPIDKPQAARLPDKQTLDRTFKTASCAYDSPSRFFVTLRGDNGQQTKLVLTCSGLSWRLTNILLDRNPLQSAAALSTATASVHPTPTPKEQMTARLNIPFNIDGIEILITGFHVGQLEAISSRHVPDKPFLLGDVEMTNTTEGTIIDVIDVWKDATVTDNFGNIYNPPMSGLLFERYDVRGLLSSESLKPGVTVRDMIVIDAPLENAQKFTLSCDPSFYRPGGHQSLNQISNKSFKIEFTRSDIK